MLDWVLVSTWTFWGGSSLWMKEWVSRVCLMRLRVRVVLSGSSFLSLKLVVFERAYCGDFNPIIVAVFLVTICCIFGLRSVYGGLMFLSGVMLIAAFANESALSLPWIPIWLRIQQNLTFLQWISELSLLKIWTIIGISNLVYLSDWRTEMESE